MIKRKMFKPCMHIGTRQGKEKEKVPEEDSGKGGLHRLFVHSCMHARIQMKAPKDTVQSAFRRYCFVPWRCMQKKD